jgi:hypothetical protein
MGGADVDSLDANLMSNNEKNEDFITVRKKTEIIK